MSSRFQIGIYTRSIATMSWIDPITGLPEVDTKGEPGDDVLRAVIQGRQVYRFANFLEAYVSVLTTTGDVWIGGAGFTVDSGMYRGLSFAGIPSEPFQVKQFVEEPDENSITFRQIVGARTQSAEVLAGQIGGPFGGIGQRSPAHVPFRRSGLIYGSRSSGLLRASCSPRLFPSMRLLRGHVVSLDAAGVFLSPCFARAFGGRKALGSARVWLRHVVDADQSHGRRLLSRIST
jgi:hypothetical protein